MGRKNEQLTSQESGIQVLNQYLTLASKFENPPQIFGELHTQSFQDAPPVNVLDIASTAAVQCYLPNIAPMRPRPEQYHIARSTLDSGHDTTRLHYQATFKLVGVSRETVHSILHSTPFYNSEQQSQRYAEAKMGFYLVPSELNPDQKSIFLAAANYTNRQYQVLSEALHPVIETVIKDNYPESGWKVTETAKRLNTKINKACQEIARYVLPIAQQSVMDHSLSELQLLRLFRSSPMPHFSDEAKYVIGKMLEVVANSDPEFLNELRKPLSSIPQIEMEPFTQEYITDRKQEFDQRLGDLTSILQDGQNSNLRHNLANTVRNVLSRPSSALSDQQALDNLLNPAKNPLLADIMESGMLDPLTSCLRQINFTFETKLSHTADSQRQRHRRTPGATPTLESVYSNLKNGQLDYITPMIIRQHSQLKNLYDQIMNNIYQNVQSALDAGIPGQHALTLLPNAQTYRVTESGDAFDWFHRFKQRLCYNAQEEIFFISVDQARQILKVLPEAAGILQAPCGIRPIAGIHPRCPEGSRWCGAPVYRYRLDQYSHHRFI